MIDDAPVATRHRVDFHNHLARMPALWAEGAGRAIFELKGRKRPRGDLVDAAHDFEPTGPLAQALQGYFQDCLKMQGYRSLRSIELPV